MIIPALLFIVGLLFLIKGGDWFVDGASALARRFHLPELLIGANVFNLVLVGGVSVSLASFTIPQSSTRSSSTMRPTAPRSRRRMAR